MKRKKDLSHEELFPHDTFPWKLVHQDGKDKKTCFFQNEGHMKKYIDRYKLKKKDYTTGYKYAED